MKPTPGIERMPRALAERYFAERLRQIKENIDTLPTRELLILAKELYDADGGPVRKMAASVARHAANRIEAEILTAGREG